jgi:hypothetical protein
MPLRSLRLGGIETTTLPSFFAASRIPVPLGGLALARLSRRGAREVCQNQRRNHEDSATHTGSLPNSSSHSKSFSASLLARLRTLRNISSSRLPVSEMTSYVNLFDQGLKYENLIGESWRLPARTSEND